MVDRKRLRHAIQGRAAHKGCRTCVGCRLRADRSELLRVAAVGGDDGWSVVPNAQGLHHGRGAWLHPDMLCLDKAIKRRALNRAFPMMRVAEFDVRILRKSIDRITE